MPAWKLLPAKTEARPVILRHLQRVAAMCAIDFHPGSIHVDRELPSALRTVEDDVPLGHLHPGGFDLIRGRNAFLRVWIWIRVEHSQSLARAIASMIAGSRKIKGAHLEAEQRHRDSVAQPGMRHTCVIVTLYDFRRISTSFSNILMV